MPLKLTIFQRKMHCCQGRRHDVTNLFPPKVLIHVVVITLFMTLRYPLNNSDVM